MSDTMSTIKTAIDSLVSVYVRFERLEYELARAEKHRDRLAEALERVDDCLSNAEDVMHGAGSDDVSRARRVISDTLAAVKNEKRKYDAQNHEGYYP
jgi:hypothetical protein